MATYTEYSQASSVDSYRNTPNQNISTGRQNSAEAHVSFNHKNKEEEKDKRQKYLTAKYGQHQMMLIRKRLAVEDWLYDKLRELYDCQVRKFYCISSFMLFLFDYSKKKLKAQSDTHIWIDFQSWPLTINYWPMFFPRGNDVFTILSDNSFYYLKKCGCIRS